MTDPNSPEAIAQRTSQPDPVVMYLIVREAIGMSVGKTAAQVGHATQMILLRYVEEKQNWMNEHCDDLVEPPADERIDIFYRWLNSSFRKVVLCADEKEWARLKEEFKDQMVLVVDAGLTELPSSTETCIGLWPMRKSQAPKIIKRLQALK